MDPYSISCNWLPQFFYSKAVFRLTHLFFFMIWFYPMLMSCFLCFSISPFKFSLKFPSPSLPLPHHLLSCLYPLTAWVDVALLLFFFFLDGGSVGEGALMVVSKGEKRASETKRGCLRTRQAGNASLPGLSPQSLFLCYPGSPHQIEPDSITALFAIYPSCPSFCLSPVYALLFKDFSLFSASSNLFTLSWMVVVPFVLSLAILHTTFQLSVRETRTYPFVHRQEWTLQNFFLWMILMRDAQEARSFMIFSIFCEQREN